MEHDETIDLGTDEQEAQVWAGIVQGWTPGTLQVVTIPPICQDYPFWRRWESSGAYAMDFNASDTCESLAVLEAISQRWLSVTQPRTLEHVPSELLHLVPMALSGKIGPVRTRLLREYFATFGALEEAMRKTLEQVGTYSEKYTGMRAAQPPQSATIQAAVRARSTVAMHRKHIDYRARLGPAALQRRYDSVGPSARDLTHQPVFDLFDATQQQAYHPDMAHTLPEIHTEVTAFVQTFADRIREVADSTAPHLPMSTAEPVFFQTFQHSPPTQFLL
ncbi:hypothetical protein [Deinococcus depolymerans]|uniref:Uncharacterized protein n=1 Tax=Deinococcus depolymerans TaxID=392408 RepID=A0ABP3LYA9_9DEIO